MKTLPFAGFLEVLRARGFGIGLHEYVALGKLLERWDRTDRDEIRDGLAALIARNEDEVREISDTFDKLYPRTTPEPVTAGAGHKRDRTSAFVQLVRRTAPWAAVLGVVMVVSYFVLVNHWTATIPEVASVAPVPSPPVSTGAVPTPLAPPPVPGPSDAAGLPDVPSSTDWRGLSWLALAAIVMTMVTLWGGRMRAAARQWMADAWRSELAELPGPFHGALVLKDFVSRLPRADVEDAATVLSRAFSPDWRGNELDVLRSLRETLRSGMQPHLIFKPRRVQEAILVLQDISQSMAVHARKVDSLNNDLRRQGVVLEHWYFDGDVATPARRPHGVPVPLAQLFRSRGDGPALIVSAGAGVPASLARADNDWLIALRRRHRLAWLCPVADPKLWPAAMQRLPVLMVPMTRAGLLQAAHALAHDDYMPPSNLGRITAAKPVTAEHIQQLRRLASVVPYPTPEFLELLRQRFAPAIPESAVLYAVDSRAASANLPFKMTDEEIRTSLSEVRSETPGLERQVRQYLLKVLLDSEPEQGSAAHLRWQASRAIHEVQLAEMAGVDAGAAVATLRRIYNGPLWEEVREIVGRQSSTGAAMNQLRTVVGASDRKTEPPPFVSRSGTPTAAFRWVGPGWRAPVVATVVAAIVAVIGAFTSPFQVQASHAIGAYSLEYLASPAGGSQGQLSVRANVPADQAPRTVQLYRDGVVWGSPVTFSETQAGTVTVDDDQAHVYQARAALASGALAVSNSIFAPSVAVQIDVQPWARVAVFRVAQPSQQPLLTLETPEVVGLPLGSYDLRFENDLNQTGNQRIDVTRNGPRTFQFTMPGFTAEDLVRQLSNAGRRPAARY